MAGGLSPIGFGAPAPVGFGGGGAPDTALGTVLFAKSLDALPGKGQGFVPANGAFAASASDALPLSRVPKSADRSDLINLTNTYAPQAIAQSPSRICVACSGGRIYHTSTAKPYSWNAATFGSNFVIQSIIWTGSMFVAVGCDYTQSNYVPIMVFSSDGINWANWTQNYGAYPTPMNTMNFQSINYINGTYILIGGNVTSSGTYGAEQVWTSSNFSSWTQAYKGFEGRVYAAMAFGKGLYVVAGFSHVLVSSDLVNWTRYSLALAMSKIAFANGVFVGAQGTTNFQVSTDGITFSKAPYVETASGSDGNGVQSVQPYKNGFLITSARFVYASQDGYVWNIIRNVTTDNNNQFMIPDATNDNVMFCGFTDGPLSTITLGALGYKTPAIPAITYSKDGTLNAYMKVA